LRLASAQHHIDVLPVSSSKLSESFPVLRSLRARRWDMKKTRHTEEQIAFALKQAETGGTAQGSGGA